MLMSLRAPSLWCLLALLIPVTAAAEGGILVVGDSLSAAYDLPREAGWVALLEQRLRDRGYGEPVVNSSTSGDTTRGGLARLPAALERHRPALVILELGGNDGLRGIPVEVTRTNLERMVALSRAAGARVLLLGIRIPPNYGPVYTEAFERIYTELAAAQGVALVPFVLEGIALDPGLMLPDGIHPNADGQRAMLENVWPVLEPMLESALASETGEDLGQG